jgi:hypothetical protein
MSVEGHASQRPKPDLNVKVPEAVKRAAARSDELITQNAPKPNGGTPISTVTIAKFDPKNPNPPDPVVASSAPTPATPVPTPEPEVDYKHQFESTQGRLTRAEEEKKQLAQQIQDMQRTIAVMHAPSASQVGQSDVRLARKITDAEIKEYGPELIETMKRAAAEAYEPIVAQLQAELAQVKGQVGGVRNAVAQDHQTQLFQTLAREIPNWEQINSDPQFLQWLSYPDELSGFPRKELLTAAFQQGQIGRVVAAFRGFLAYQAAYGPGRGNGQGPGNGAVTLESNASTQELDLVSLAAPGRAKTGQTEVPPEKPLVYRAEISEFYRDVSLGKYKGKDQEYAAIQAQIQDAIKEGRIR